MSMWIRVLKEPLQPSGEVARRTGASADVGAALLGDHTATPLVAEIKRAATDRAERDSERVGHEVGTAAGGGASGPGAFRDGLLTGGKSGPGGYEKIHPGG